jgi:GntR family transcriptional regulator
MLKVKEGATLMILNIISYLVDGTPIEYYHAVHRSDRSRFKVELAQVWGRGKFLYSLGFIEDDHPASNNAVF